MTLFGVVKARRRVAWSRWLAAAFAVIAWGQAHAGPTLTLSAEARARVANDEMVVAMAVEREGPQVGVLNDQVNREVADSLERARKVPGVQSRVGALQTIPTIGPQGRITGYRVRGELLLESRDFSALGQLAGTLGARLQVAWVSFRVSPQRRTEEQARLLKEAADAFRARSQAAALAFGFRDYELRTLSLDPGHGPMPRMFAQPMAVEGVRAAAPMPTEGGDSEIVVGVSGSIELR